MGPQNPSVANDISERALSVVICFSFSTCCCPCKTSDTATLLAHRKLPVVAGIWHVYTYSRAHGVLPSNQYFPRKRMFYKYLIVLAGYSARSKIGGSYTLFLPVLLCALVLLSCYNINYSSAFQSLHNAHLTLSRATCLFISAHIYLHASTCRLWFGFLFLCLFFHDSVLFTLKKSTMSCRLW